ncbi:phosphatase domain-containing putative toxin [Prosthecobacter dejongeii]|uniref:Protein tyrosine phosphatase n=1 Tax=Prosthecobacter dejongeii TaxID=48465 RepID=A0A7W8DN44_9BACT|nr:protein tyrosine phosphatase [Prosthecobacter dejongeii]
MHFSTVIRVEIPSKLLACARPGYDFGRNAPVSKEVVKVWLDEAKVQGARSILCLLAAQHLRLYNQALPGGLLQAYRLAGFEVGHVPVGDHRSPPLSQRQLQQVLQLYEGLPKPVLIHCSAGLDRTGAAVAFIKKQRKDSTT